MTKARMQNIGEHIELGICVPCLGGWKTGFGRSLVALSQHLMTWRPDPSIGIRKFRFRLYTQESSMLVQSRHNLIVAALKDKCTHILSLDSDMTFPKDTFERLLMRDKEFVAVNATTRSYPVMHIAHDLEGRRLDSRKKYGVQKVQHVGMAVALLSTRMFSRISPPLFMMEWIPEMGSYCGEDVYFCAKVQDAGFDVWIDHDLSHEVGHLGAQHFGPNMIGLEKPEPFVSQVVDMDEGEDISGAGMESDSRTTKAETS